MFGIGPTELIVVGAVVILLFGPTIIRRLADGALETAREFHKVKDELKLKE